jgi:hypothetical protein
MPFAVAWATFQNLSEFPGRLRVGVTPQPASIAAGMVFSTDVPGCVGTMQVLAIGPGHSFGDHFAVYIPPGVADDRHHPLVLIDINYLGRDVFSKDFGA